MAHRMSSKTPVSDDVARELKRLGYVIDGPDEYTIDGKEGRFRLVGILETGAANGVRIYCLMSGGDLTDGATYAAPIGRVDRAAAAAVA